MRRTFVFSSALVGVLLGVSACTKSLRYEADLSQLMSAIRTENAKETAVRDSLARVRAGVVRVAGSPDQLTLSVNLVEAELASVLHRALEASKLPYVIEDHGPAGRTSARFENKPLLDGLNLLLGREGFHASMRDGVAVVHPAPVSMPDSTYRADEIIQREIRLDHLDDKSTSGIVQQFLTAGQLKSQYDASRGRVLVSGPRKEVYEATAMLHRADRAVRHVLIEALVVQFDEAMLASLGVDWSKGQTGRFSEIFFAPGDQTSTLGFKNSEPITPSSFVATVQALGGADKARIIARPFITARSGDSAMVHISNARFYLQQVVSAGVPTAQLQTVETGVKLSITPTAMNDERVRVDLRIEESQFIPTADKNTTAETAKNEVSSSMQVPTGQTIIIGGLALDRQTHSTAGVPLLSRIPFFSMFFAKSTDSRSNSEVVIFLTPRIWTPDVDLPFVRPDLFQIDTTPVTSTPRKP